MASPQIRLDEVERFAAEMIRLQARKGNAGGAFTLETALVKVMQQFFPQDSPRTTILPTQIPFALRRVPTLQTLAMRQARIVAKVLCAVATRPVVTISDLEDEICFAEGVAAFSQLGFGPSVTSFEVIQQYFRVNQPWRPHRISANQFMAFLVADEEARRLLAAGADAGDLVNGFAKRLRLRHTNDAGVHIQNLPWLLSLLRAEAGRVGDTLERRLKQTGAMSAALATLAERIALELIAKFQPGLDLSSKDEVQLMFNDPPTEVLPPSMCAGGLVVTFQSHSAAMRQRAALLAAEKGSSTAQPLAAADLRMACAPAQHPGHRGTQARNGRGIGRSRHVVEDSSDQVVDLDALMEEHESTRSEPETLEEIIRRSLWNRVLYSLTNEEAESIARCVHVFAPATTSATTATMSTEDFKLFQTLCTDACVGTAFMAHVPTIADALKERSPLVSGALLAYHRSLVATEHHNAAGCLAEALGSDGVPTESIDDSLLLPIVCGGMRSLLTVSQCTQAKQWPMCVLSGSAADGLFPLAALSACAPQWVRCVDTDILKCGSSKDVFRMALVALQGLGLKATLPFPQHENHPFPLAIQSLLEKPPIAVSSDAQRDEALNDALLRVFFLANDMWCNADAVACGTLKTSRWIVAKDPFSRQSAVSLRATTFRAAPHELMDPSPRLLRLFQNVAAFVPNVRPAAPQAVGPAQPLSMQFLASIGVVVKPTAHVALRVLQSIPVGAMVPLHQLDRIYTFLASCGAEEVADGLAVFDAVVVIPEAGFHLPSTGSTDDTFVQVSAVVAAEEVCWLRISSSDDEQELFHRSLSSFYRAELHDFFVRTVGVAEKCHLRCWTSSMSWNRHRIASTALLKCLPALRTLTIKCFVQHTLQPLAVRTRFRPGSVVSQIEPLFPCIVGWKAARDRILFVGDVLSLTDVYKYGTAATGATSIHFFVFGHRIEQPLRQILLEMGLHDFSVSADHSVSFEAFNMLRSTELHAKIAACAPQIQRHMKKRFPSYYQQVQKLVGQSLERLLVVTCKNPFVVHSVQPSPQRAACGAEEPFHIRKPMTTFFDRSKSVLYSSDDEFAPHVASEAVAELFCPLHFRDVFESIQQVLQVLLRAKDVEREGKLHLLDNEEEVALESNERWVVSAPFNERYRQHYPPGADGFGCPMIRNNAQLPQGIITGPGAWATLEFADEQVVLRQVATSTVGCVPGATLATFKREREEASNSDDDSSDDEEDEDGSGGGVISFSRDRWSRLARKRQQRLAKREAQNASRAPILSTPKDGRGYDVSAERFAFEQLRQTAPRDVVIKWVHENGEQGTPFDIVAVRGTGPNERIVHYYEVKSTCTKHRKDFELSLRELLFAAKFGNQYTILRVFSASESQLTRMNLESYDDPVGMWQRGRLTMTGDVKVVII